MAKIDEIKEVFGLMKTEEIDILNEYGAESAIEVARTTRLELINNLIVEIVSVIEKTKSCEHICVTGSFALNLMGLSSEVNDVDLIFVNPNENFATIISKLFDKNVDDVFEMLDNAMYNGDDFKRFLYRGIKIDFIAANSCPHFLTTINGKEIKVSKLPDIIEAKLSYNKIKHIMQVAMMAEIFDTTKALDKFKEREKEKLKSKAHWLSTRLFNMPKPATDENN